MPRKPKTVPRKLPTQERARATVEAIVDATAKVLVKDGYERASTNRVAEFAGVSIGSLYQYFPNKEALVLAVMERHRDRMLQLFEGQLVEHAAEGVVPMTRRLVRSFLQMNQVEPKLHRVLLEQVPRIERTATMCGLKDRLARLVSAYLDAHAGEIDVDDSELAAWTLITAVENVVLVALLDRPDLFDSPRLEREMVRIALRYLGVAEPQQRRAHPERGEARA